MLYAYCKGKSWEGYDPFDGLNSKLFQALPFFKKNKLIRLIFLHLNKRSMINFRPLLLVKKGRNPKGMGLFLTATLRLYKKTGDEEFLNLAKYFISWLENNSVSGYSGSCWGYNFDWQSRAFFLPKGTPNVVNTSFIGRAFLEAYDILKQEKYLATARSACNFILRNLNRWEDEGALCFSYSPIDRYFVHNAVALASSLLAKTFELSGEENLAQDAKKSIQYVVNHQNYDGAWSYGEDAVAQNTGVDSFHTGFILESLKIYTESSGDEAYHENIRKGLDFYQNRFFLKNGRAKYFPDSLYPVDIHCAAQGVITLLQLKEWGANQELCTKILEWIIDNVQDKTGYFYYQKGRFFTNRIVYMRWTQAWAFYALATYLANNE